MLLQPCCNASRVLAYFPSKPRASGGTVVLVRSAFPLRTLRSADLHVRFCDGHEGSIADASELHESGSP